MPVVNGAASLVRHAGEVYPYARAADGPLDVWDPATDIPDAMVWRADEGVTLD